MAKTEHDKRQKSIRQTNAIDDLSDEKDRELAETIGLIAMEWSRIHDRLSRIFARVTQINEEIAYAIWNSIPTDNLQRSMLKKAACEAYHDEQFLEKKGEIIQLIRKLDNASANRNNFIHCPFSFLLEGDRLLLIPNELSNNKHARKLKGSEILKEAHEQYRNLLKLNELSYQVFIRLL